MSLVNFLRLVSDLRPKTQVGAYNKTVVLAFGVDCLQLPFLLEIVRFESRSFRFARREQALEASKRPHSSLACVSIVTTLAGEKNWSQRSIYQYSEAFRAHLYIWCFFR